MQAGYPVNNAHTTTNVTQWRGMDDPNTIGHLSVSTGTTTANAITSWKRLQKIQSNMPVQQRGVVVACGTGCTTQVSSLANGNAE